MRKIALALGCLVIAATVNAGDSCAENFLIAKCSFGNNGFVTFKERAPAAPKASKGKKILAQQEDDEAAGSEEEEEAGSGEEAEADDTAALEGGKKMAPPPKVIKKECENESASESEDCADAELAGETGKVVNIACTYTEQNKKKDTAKVRSGSRSLSRDKNTKTVTKPGRGRSPAPSECSDDEEKTDKEDSCSERSPSPVCKKPPPCKKAKFEEDCKSTPTLEGDFHFEKLEKNTKYRLSVNEYNDLGKKCKLVGEFYNPKNLKAAPGVKTFKTDKKGKFDKPFKNLDLAISTRDSIINRSCVLEKVIEKESDCSDDEKHEEFKKCALITWEPPYFVGLNDK